MLITERSMGALVVEESKSASLVIGGFSAVIGVGLLVAGATATKGEWLMLGIGAVFAFFGVKTLLFFKVRTHRFDRLRRKVFIEAKGHWKTERREIPFESIAEIDVEKVSGRKASYYIHYVLRDGERIPWSETYDGAMENTFECANAAREALGLNPPP